MDGFVQRVQIVEHDENKSKEEWVSVVIDMTPRIVKVLLKRMERACERKSLQ